MNQPASKYDQHPDYDVHFEPCPKRTYTFGPAEHQRRIAGCSNNGVFWAAQVTAPLLSDNSVKKPLQ